MLGSGSARGFFSSRLLFHPCRPLLASPRSHKANPANPANPGEEAASVAVQNPKVLLRCLANNIFAAVSNDTGRLLASLSSGSIGFKNTAKVSEKAALGVIDAVKRKLDKFGAESVKLELRGFNPMRNVLIYQLRRSGIAITEVLDSTGIPFNGCRPKKTRRL